MRHRRLGHTGLIVSEVALGSMQFGGKMNMGNLGQEDTTRMVKVALDNGINFIDMSTWRPQEAASLVIDICRFTSDTLQTFSFRIGSKCSRESSGFLAIVVLTSESSRNELVRKGRCECLQSPVSFQLCSGQVRVWFVLSHS